MATLFAIYLRPPDPLQQPPRWIYFLAAESAQAGVADHRSSFTLTLCSDFSDRKWGHENGRFPTGDFECSPNIRTKCVRKIIDHQVASNVPSCLDSNSE